MPDTITIISTTVACIVSYLLGSIPFGLLAGKLSGIDIREHGSGNIGATNVFRTLGKGRGIAVFLLDVLKGLVPVALAAKAGQLLAGSSLSQFATFPILSLILIGLCAILGHNFPLWLGFKGGKGVATSAGVLLGILPGATAIAAGIWLIVFLVTRYVSLASIAAAIVLPTITLLRCLSHGWGQQSLLLMIFTLLVGALGILRHRENIGRLLSGTENKADFTLAKLFGTRPKGYKL